MKGASSNKTASKILAALEMRAREPYSSIAARLDISEQLVQYHFEKALKEKIILGCNAILDLPKIGCSFNLIYLRFFGPPTKTERKWVEHVDSKEGVSLVARTVGRWHATLAIIAKNNEDLLEKISLILAEVKGKIAELIITTEVECAYSSLQILHSHKAMIFGSQPYEKAFLLDETDQTILQILAKNCRVPATEIAKQLKISSSTVQRRIARLEEEKVILGYRLQIDYERLGFHQYRLLLKLSDFSSNIIERIKKEVLASGIVQSVSRYLGLADIDLRCNTASLEELANFIDSLKDKFSEEIVNIEIVPLFYWKRINYFPV